MGLFKKKTAQKKTTFAPRKPQSHPFWGLLILAISLLYFVALFFFEAGQWNQVNSGADPSQNPAGNVGVFLAGNSVYLFGLVATLIPVLLFWIAYLLIFKKASRVGFRLCVASLVIIVSLCGFANLIETYLEPQQSADVAQEVEILSGDEVPTETRYFFNGMGGTVGQLLYNEWFTHYIGPFGTTLVLAVALVFGIVFLATDNLTRSVENWHEQRAQKKKDKQKQKQSMASAKVEKKKKSETRFVAAPKPSEPKKKELRAGESVLEGFNPDEAKKDPALSSEEDEQPTKKKGTRFLMPKKKPAKDVPAPAPAAAPDKAAASAKPTLVVPKKPGIKIVEAEQTERAEVQLPDRRGDYTFPKVDLLADPIPPAEGETKEDYSETAEALVQTLNEFNVKVEPSSVQTGPVITRYEVKPAPGVRVEKIASLDKNIALGLKALAVRILAPVPGKGTVGIEVPNKNPLAVRMKEIVESKSWGESSAEIPIVLGKDVTGKPIVEDLTKMPHMLIAGSTGSGKTVCINAVIASLLYHSSPDDLRFIMVDPKVVEMQIYNQLPHMLIPVVTEPKKVPGALKYLLREMERRYQIFAKVGVRNIAGFNSKVVKEKEEKAAAEKLDRELSSEMSPEERAAAATMEVPRDLELEIPEGKLPYIVCIIDELADLMMVAPQDIETGVARLAQLARAAGIHLILATQRPSVNVITGVIKANLPTRISFKVASKVDSRTILDTGGAEALIGKGDMLFVPPGSHSLVRAQGAFVSDEEINGIVEFVHEKNGPPVFDEAIQAAVESAGEEGEETGAAAGTYEDELVPDAIGVLKTTKRASTSMLQRRLKIGYNRAARIMEILEDEGIVGPENGSSPREILRDLDSL
ncbi:DNA translocase FtsK [Rubellicoccus peritrichatus]|uniref:DNA translocase FtsK n=1 Tax=Rubellicoccus peritrichatus TaxID=3080537 RepID=A0AAQ3LCN9_9BACT|nr:DNA translocase FtsK [Puniceicoccus sp. CR14]WOO41455.1 DNA translocase FtsK [Puniceicoccus sp. CR14]